MAAHGVMGYVDFVSVHGFPLDWNHWELAEWPARVAEAAQVSGRPVWVTEVGVGELEGNASGAWLKTYRELVTEGLAGASAVIAPTRWMAEQMVHLYGLSAVPRVIANGISPMQPGCLPRKLQAITAGRLWDAAKGLAILREIESPFPLYVAGEQGSDSLDGAQWLGALPHEDLLGLFGESAIYLATSVYEPFGLAPLEAARCGCAIVARDLPTFREVWGDSALYFRSAESLQGLLKSLADNPRRLKAARCRAGARAGRYTAKAMTQQYLAMYRALAGASTSSQERALAHA